ncbi:MAG: DEAD/DEAH box helicase, partial [Theionarchaea archaeon]|nr:DEAD/DEAH box helicase [Theionarchaea archaeon]
MTSRLRRDLGEAPLSIKVEKMSGALELDAFEEILIESQEVTFDILVTTPEKLNLLLRQSIERKLRRPLALLIVDEAHNLEDKKRGLNLEMLLSTAKGDCEKANFLLLTPFVPNSDQIAKWLNPDSPRAISIELRWEPNDRVLGVFYPVGSRKEWEIFYKPLVTSQDTIVLDDEITLGKNERFLYPVSKLKNTKYLLTAVTASKLRETGNILIIAMGIDDTWKIARELTEILPEESPDDRIKLVQRFIAAELGPEFPLVKYLSKRLGVHHSGLPEEVRYLIEWLMEEGVLSVLVATTTIAQGINFPVSTILMSSYAYPWMKNMPIRDFWNLAGRAGRMDQSSLGVVGIAVGDRNGKDMLKTVEFVRKKTEDLTSVLVELVEGAFDLQEEFSLEKLENQDEWSAFLQYIAHLYNQSENLDRLVSKLEIMLRRTYGYSLLDAERRKFLSKAVKQYISDLDENKHLATLSDMTGFSPNSIQETIYNIGRLGISQSEWEGSRLFSSSSNLLRNLVGVMLRIPEVRKTLEITIPGVSITNSTLSKLIIQWVSGREIVDITREFWGRDDCDAISGCVKAIYSKITNAAPWGLAAIQKMPGSGIDFDKLSEEDVKRLKNIPAMIYYGVNTEEAIVMRMNNVPRSIAQQLGELYKE